MDAQAGAGKKCPQPEQPTPSRGEPLVGSQHRRGRIPRPPEGTRPLRRGGDEPSPRTQAGERLPRVLADSTRALRSQDCPGTARPALEAQEGDRADPEVAAPMQTWASRRQAILRIRAPYVREVRTFDPGCTEEEEEDLERFRYRARRDASVPLYRGKAGELFPWFNRLKEVLDLWEVRSEDLDFYLPKALTSRVLGHAQRKRGNQPWTLDRLVYCLAEEYEPSSFNQPLYDLYAMTYIKREFALSFLGRLERQHALAYPGGDMKGLKETLSQRDELLVSLALAQLPDEIRYRLNAGARSLPFDEFKERVRWEENAPLVLKSPLEYYKTNRMQEPPPLTRTWVPLSQVRASSKMFAKIGRRPPCNKARWGPVARLSSYARTKY